MRAMATSTRAVISPSPRPMSMCTPAMAGSATRHGTVPEAASSPAHATAARTVLHHAAKEAATMRPNSPFTARLIPW